MPCRGANRTRSQLATIMLWVNSSPAPNPSCPHQDAKRPVNQVTQSPTLTTSTTVSWIVGLFDFLMFSSALTSSCERVPGLTSDNFTCCHTETEWGGHDVCLNWSHTDTEPTSGEQMRGSNPRHPYQELCVFSWNPDQAYSLSC